jgi:chemotaxis family two-component system response regulator Rcp1
MAELPHHRNCRVLLIEDNGGDIDLLKLALKNAHVECELTVLEDGGEALQLIRRNGKHAARLVPDVVILDLNLPKNDGLEVLAAMRRAPEFAQVPVIVLSSSSSARERAQMEELSVTRHITKPTDLDELLEIGMVVKGLLGEPTPA